MIQSITKHRFDVLASYARAPRSGALGVEVGWYEAIDAAVVATMILDTDGEYSSVLMAPDLALKYRWVGQTDFFDTPEAAVAALVRTVISLVPRLDLERVQGDEAAHGPVDFLRPVRPADRLHPSFVQLIDGPGWAAARSVVEHMMRWYEDVDGNFVEQFQTTGFDARLWELYLFATLTEAGYLLDRSAPVPDFVARGARGEFALEATTVNPSVVKGKLAEDPPTDTDEDQRRYMRDYMPIRYAGPLTKKLQKKYWEREHVRDLPLVFAIQDFHEPMSMTWSRTALPIYLYGYAHEGVRNPDGSLTVQAHKVTMHRWHKKEVLSNFFGLLDAENVSAVIHNSSGTMSKFNRIGVGAGFGVEGTTLKRVGWVINPDPHAVAPMQFVHEVTEGYPETWIEGMDVYHNPRAVHPLDPELLPHAAHHLLRPDGIVESTVPQWQPLSSTTAIVVAT